MKIKQWMTELEDELTVTFWIVAIATVCKVIEKRTTDAVKKKLGR